MAPWAPWDLGPREILGLGPREILGPLGPMGLGPREILGPLGPWGLGPGLGPSVGSVGPAWGPQPAARARARPGALNQSGETLTKKSLFGVFWVNI